MASPAWLAGFLAAFTTSDRFAHLLSLTDHQLLARGYDRKGLERSYISGLSGR